MVLAQPFEHGAQHPAVDDAHAPAVLTRSDEARRGHQRAAGIAHAQKHLEVERLGGRRERHDGLHLQVQALDALIGREALHQLHLRLVGDQAGRVALVHRQALLQAALGVAAGVVGGGHHVADGTARGHLDEADGAAHVERARPHPVGAGADAGDDALADEPGERDVGVREDDQELVAPDTPDLHVARQHLRDACAHLLQHVIASGMAEQVVDELEAVQVQIGQRQRLALVALRQGRFEDLLDAAAVEYARERIVVGQHAQVLGGARFFGHVLQRAFDAAACLGGPHHEAPGQLAIVAPVHRELGFGLALAVHHLVQLQPGGVAELRAPGATAVVQQAVPQHVHQRGVGAQEAPLQIQGEQADGHGLVGILQLRLHLQALDVLLAHLFGDGQRGQQARRQGRRDVVHRAHQHLHAVGRRDDFRKARQEGDPQRSAVPQGHPRAGLEHDAHQAHRHQQQPQARGHPHHGQVHAVGQEHGSQQQRDAGPLRATDPGPQARAVQVLLEQVLVQRDGQEAVDRHGERAGRKQPWRGHQVAQPLHIPAGRDGPHPERDHQPGGEQHVQRLPVDQCRHQHEHAQHHQAAFEQAQVAVELQHRGLQIGLRPPVGLQPRRADEAGAAKNALARAGLGQAEARLHGDQVAAGLLTRGLAERTQALAIPAGHVHRVARGEQHGGRLRHRHRQVHQEPDRLLGQVGVVKGLERPVRQRRQRVFRRELRGCLGQHAHHQGVATGRQVIALPEQQRPHGHARHGDGNDVDGHRAQQPVHKDYAAPNPLPCVLLQSR